MIHLAVCDSREDRKWLKDALETFRAGEREIDASFYENAEDLARDLEIRFPLDLLLIDPGCLEKETLLENLKTKNRLAEILILTDEKDPGNTLFPGRCTKIPGKPTEEELRHILTRAAAKVRLRKSRKIIFKVENGIRVEKIEDILYFQSSGHKVIVHMKRGKFTIGTPLHTIKDMLDAVSPGQFASPSKGYIVNCKVIRAVLTRGIDIRGSLIPLSRGTYRKFRDEYLEYIFSD